MALLPFSSAPIQATAVTPGSYTATNLTVNKYGQITAAANGTAGSTSPGGSTTQVQYNNGGVFAGVSFLTIDNASTPKNLVNTGTYKITSDGNNGFLFDNGALGKNNWNLKCGSDGTFLFDQGGALSGRLKLGGASAGTYWDITPDYSNSYFKVMDNKAVTTFSNTLDNGSGGMTVTGPFAATGSIRVGYNTTAITATTTLTTSSVSIQDVNATAGAVSITPPATTTAGYEFTVTKTDASANAVTLVGSFNGTTNPTLATQWNYMTFVTTGTSGQFRIRGNN